MSSTRCRFTRVFLLQARDEEELAEKEERLHEIHTVRFYCVGADVLCQMVTLLR